VDLGLKSHPSDWWSREIEPATPGLEVLPLGHGLTPYLSLKISQVVKRRKYTIESICVLFYDHSISMFCLFVILIQVILQRFCITGDWHNDGVRFTIIKER